MLNQQFARIIRKIYEKTFALNAFLACDIAPLESSLSPALAFPMKSAFISCLEKQKPCELINAATETGKDLI